MAPRERVYRSLDDKLENCRPARCFRMDYIEGGWPGSNPKDVEFFQRAPALGLFTPVGGLRQHATERSAQPTTAIYSTDRRETPVVTLVGKS